MRQRKDPRLAAEWIIETIVDDFAQSLEPPERPFFYARMAELALARREREERRKDYSEPGTSNEIQ